MRVLKTFNDTWKSCNELSSSLFCFMFNLIHETNFFWLNTLFYKCVRPGFLRLFSHVVSLIFTLLFCFGWVGGGVGWGGRGMLIVNWCANFWGFRYLCRYGRDEAWTLVIFCTSSIWSCDFCWPEGQGGILEWCLAFPCNFPSCINSKMCLFSALIASKFNFNLSCAEQVAMILIGANVLVTLVTCLEREILRVCCQLKWL